MMITFLGQSELQVLFAMQYQRLCVTGSPTLHSVAKMQHAVAVQMAQSKAAFYRTTATWIDPQHSQMSNDD